MSDLLDDLVKASREIPVVHAEADETRRRIVAAANHRARTTSRRRLAPWVLPLVAALAATGALAAGPLGVTQALLGGAPAPAPTHTAQASATAVRGTTAPSQWAPQIVEEPSTAPLPTPVPDPDFPPSAQPLDPPAAAATTAANPPDAPTAPAVIVRWKAAQPPSAPTAVRSALAGAAEPAAAAVAAHAEASVAAEPQGKTLPALPTPPAPPADASDDLYRAAHERHFRGGDPSGAVEAWDRYLAAAPRGRFAVEARYNRALALLRAGRRSEGLAALQPFANGTFGQYRREDAQRLLGAAGDAGAP